MRVRTTDCITDRITGVPLSDMLWPHKARPIQLKKGGNYYIQMTVPKWARAAFGRNQHRKSAGTTDKRIAEARQHDIEAQLRQEIMRKYESSTLWEPNSPYRKAVETLGLEETFYRGEWVDDVTDVVEIPLSQPPKDDGEKRQAFEAIYNAARQVQANTHSVQAVNHPRSQGAGRGLTRRIDDILMRHEQVSVSPDTQRKSRTRG